MLFNSFEFIFLFLPITLAVFFLVSRAGHRRISIAWLVSASLFFYGWWNPSYIWLFGFTLVFNYLCGAGLSQQSTNLISKKLLLFFGITVDLLLLGYFKYANFFAENVNSLTGTDFNLGTIILPLGISFFTFQEIAYLVDAYRGEVKEHNFLNFCLFVTFFPQLIAGPIIHHKDVMPQFSNSEIFKFNSQNIAIGFTIFILGLAKKVFLADTVASNVSPVFNAGLAGTQLTFFEAWAGALAYSLQLYFDFSGYSDMAVGSARMFGIKLPINFNSPYKSTSIIEFWRRWHITLSHFLRDYLYIPLGGSRRGQLRRYLNLIVTMLIGGIWHGAGWTFIFWGGLHGLYLSINHLWNALRRSLGHNLKENNWFSQGVGWSITLVAVVISWVFFRAENMQTAWSIVSSMVGSHGFSTESSLMIDKKIILVVAAFALLLPNTQQWLVDYEPTLNAQAGTDQKADVSNRLWKNLRWRPNWVCSLCLSSLAFFAILKAISVVKSEFLYFNF